MANLVPNRPVAPFLPCRLAPPLTPDGILPQMSMMQPGTGWRTMAWVSPVAFGVLAAVLAGVGAIGWNEALWASLSVVLVFVPTGWWAGGGVRRHGAEAMLVPVVVALTMVGGATMRWMLVPPLLMLAAWASVAAAWDRVPEHRRPLLAALLGLSARSAVGVGLAGFDGVRIAAALVVAAVAPWAAARRGGRRAAEVVALVAAVVPWQRSLVGAAAVSAVCVVWGVVGRRTNADKLILRWVPGVGAAALLAAAFAPWFGLSAGVVFPGSGWPARLALIFALIVTPRLRPGLAGAVWFLAVLSLGPVQPPSPEQRAFVLTDDHGRLTMSRSTGAPYVIDLDLECEMGEDGRAPAAVLRFAGTDHDVPTGGVTDTIVWRPHGVGAGATWRAAVRSRFAVPAGESPILFRHPDLGGEVTVRVETLGSVRATPPRDWMLPSWLLAAAAAVALIQLVSRSWRSPPAVLPWLVLVLGSLVARVSVEPLRLLGERLAVDLALAALLVAWLPAAQAWLRDRRVFVTVAALLAPLALATPHLTPSLYGDEPFHLIVMESMATDHDLDISDDLDLARRPQNELYAPGRPFFHSPALGLALLPGYAAAGRGGALLLLALMGAALVALIARRAGDLGLGDAQNGLLVLILAATYPLAIFATQIWPELPGALAVAAMLVLVSGPGGGRWLALMTAVAVAAVKTRLGLIAFPIAAVAWLRRGWIRGLLVLGSAVVAGLAVGWLTMGHPFGPYRRLQHLVPQDPSLVVRVLGGLAFDPAGGLAFTAPLLLAAMAGVALLWRRGGPGERAMLIGCALTVGALLHSIEWYGGGAPPARYLVPMMPAFALSAAMVLKLPLRWRRLGVVLLPPSLVAWWVLITRPHLSVNPGDGGFWLADSLARRFAVDARHFFPSFLVPNTATVVVPVVLLVVVFGAARLTIWRPAVGVVLRRSWVALWLAAAAALVLTLDLRHDGVVEFEAPQVRHSGGSPIPPPGTASRFLHRRGWRLDNGDRVVVPLHLRGNSELVLEGWLMGTARKWGRLELRWDDGESVIVPWRGEGSTERIVLPSPPGPGHHRLGIRLLSPPHGAVALDRLLVRNAG